MVNDVPAPAPAAAGHRVDLRGLDPSQARARAFAETFKVRPGARLSVLVNRSDVEAEVLKWAGELGHRHVRNVRVEDGGLGATAIELIKMEARR